MNLTQELAALLKRNFPCLVREEAAILRLLDNSENNVFQHRNATGELIAAAVVHGSTLYLLCVDSAYRNAGIGSALLHQAEDCVRAKGFSEIIVGAGEDYLMPGVPTSVMPYPEALMPGRIYAEADDAAARFFAKRGYKHAWGDCNCFDMRMELMDMPAQGPAVGDVIAGVRYRWATPADLPALCACTDDAHAPFTQYYRDASLYDGSSSQRVLLAEENGCVLGTLIVSQGTEGAERGSIGCTTVRHAARGRHIAVHLVQVGTWYLKVCGLHEGFLGYTYSGLDKLYGHAGYRICIYYFMAQKALG